MRICVAWLKSLRKSQKKNSTEADDTAAATAVAPARESAPDIAETDGATEEPASEITATE